LAAITTKDGASGTFPATATAVAARTTGDGRARGVTARAAATTVSGEGGRVTPVTPFSAGARIAVALRVAAAASATAIPGAEFTISAIPTPSARRAIIGIGVGASRTATATATYGGARTTGLVGALASGPPFPAVDSRATVAAIAPVDAIASVPSVRWATTRFLRTIRMLRRRCPVGILVAGMAVVSVWMGFIPVLSERIVWRIVINSLGGSRVAGNAWVVCQSELRERRESCHE